MDLLPGKVAEILGLSVRTVQYWCDDGKLPCITLANGHRRIPIDSLYGLLQQQGLYEYMSRLRMYEGRVESLIVFNDDYQDNFMPLIDRLYYGQGVGLVVDPTARNAKLFIRMVSSKWVDTPIHSVLLEDGSNRDWADEFGCLLHSNMEVALDAARS